MSEQLEPLEIPIRALDAFWLRRRFETPVTLTTDFIVGCPNHLRIEAQAGPVKLVGKLWTDGTHPKWTSFVDHQLQPFDSQAPADRCL